MLGPNAAAVERRDAARHIAQRAGAFLATERPDALAVETKSTPTDAVTHMDRGSERIITQFLGAEFSGDGIVAEEGGAASSSTGVWWIVDPLDGTVNYLYGRREYAVSIAAVSGSADPDTWTPLVGVIFAPELGDLYVAAAGAGASWNGTPIAARSAHPELAMSLLGTGFAYDADVRGQQARLLAGLMGQVRDVRRSGSAALDLAAVATGRLDAYFECGLGPWDFAAGALVAAEAGNTVTGGYPDGKPVPPNSRCVIAGSAPTCRWLSEQLA